MDFELQEARMILSTPSANSFDITRENSKIFIQYCKIKMKKKLEKEAENDGIGNANAIFKSFFLVYRACIAAGLNARKIKLGDASEIFRFASYHWKMLSEQHKKAYEKISLEVKQLYLIRISNTQFKEYNQNMSNLQGHYQVSRYYQDESYHDIIDLTNPFTEHNEI
ncbi:9060_t:CDS:2 [Ambispora leptoticha]|uniref:9060_t:CDS:1 n=1 Tax=Ambispora leptoticha TaxID=144679 RepID=A0A9N9DQP7_9GLOM|nr:9060_t:CDS:2 [Ambispora leptoticha]